jgi:predicted nucleic acid-binding protein
MDESRFHFEERRDPDAPVTRADLANVHRQLETGEVRMTAIEAELRMNTALTADIRALLEAVRGGMRVLGAIGTAAQWLAKIAGAVAGLYGLWQLIRHGGSPK